MKRFLLFFALTVLCASTTCFAKKYKYQITVTIHNTADSMLMLGYYHIEHTYVIDTAFINKKGQFVFQKDKTLDPGLYFFCNQKGEFAEFAIYNDKPFFKFETDAADWTANMKVTGSEENELMFNYHRTNAKIYEETMSKKSQMDSAAFKTYYQEQRKKMSDFDREFMNAHPRHILSVMMRAERDVPVPLVNEQGDSLSQKQRFDYFMEHYFDSMDLGDPVFLRTPKSVFHRKITEYLDKYLKGAPPEVITPYIDSMIARARPAEKTFHWLIHFITEKYLQSGVMGYDAIYVHMVKRYYETGESTLSSPSFVDEQVVRANKWEKLLIGKVAPELILYDTLGIAHSLHGLPNKYTLLVFWSPTCGHCKTMVPALYKKYLEYKDKYDIAGFAILSEPDEPTTPLWKKFIRDHNFDWINLDGGVANIDWHDVYDVITTPQIFLLDKDKKIIGKHLNADLFEKILQFNEEEK
ncbi:MAG: DUF5106 domain-containing protein [Bacteroidales bacterium]|nr:DUF5106 domain-containing protein [Candidatus Colimorpha pelethequi]